MRSQDPYQVWLELNAWRPVDAQRLRVRLARARGRLPRISVVMPVYAPPIPVLERSIESVQQQVYGDWELCIADDASPDRGILDCLARHAESDHRIHVSRNAVNLGIAGATNAAAALAKGDFLAFLDHDDELTPDALAEMALYVAERPDTDFLYSDDDKIGSDGIHFEPQFKPDWSPELLLSYMYMGHLLMVRRELFEELGGTRTEFDGSQDYDFALRATQRARHVGHIPRILYHWRAIPGSMAHSVTTKPAAFEAGRRAVEDALRRRGIASQVTPPAWAPCCGISQHDFADTGPEVAILIPTRNHAEILKNCVQALRSTTYRNFRVVIADNSSDDPATLRYLAEVDARVLRIGNNGPSFNYAHVNNRAVEQIDAPYILFLNDDTQVLEPRWLSRMMGFAQMPGVGAVGARLLFPDGRLQHAGIVHGLFRGLIGHAFKFFPPWDRGYLSHAALTRNYSAVTGACLLTPRRLFLELGGFNEKEFPVGFNDIDYGYRLVDRGYRCVYCAGAELIHFEGYSRFEGCSRPEDNPDEVAAFRRKYAGRVDPWYNPNLSLDNDRFEIQPRRLAHPRTTPIRALLCSHNLNLEGAPIALLELTVGLKEQGVLDPVVYSPDSGPLADAYARAGIPVIVRKSPAADVFSEGAFDLSLDRFAGFLHEQEIEVVHGNTLMSYFAVAAAQRAGLPSLWNVHESEPWQTYFQFLAEPLRHRAYECFRFPYRIVFVAEATRRAWSALDSRKTFTVIYNGLNRPQIEASAARWDRASARARLGLADGEVCILLVGTVCSRKGQHDLPQALAAMDAALWPRLRCFIVGAGRPGDEYNRGLHDLVAQLPKPLHDRVRIVHDAADISPYYRAADIKVCSSRIESAPRVLAEAMAHALPIVTTPVFGIPEQVRENLNALFYAPGDIGKLATHLGRLVGDDALRQRMGAGSRRVLAALPTYEEMLAQWAEVFREAADSPAPRRKTETVSEAIRVDSPDRPHRPDGGDESAPRGHDRPHYADHPRTRQRLKPSGNQLHG
ncbi:MAG: glycosyltransferase [Thermoguttaceae bacterium]